MVVFHYSLCDSKCPQVSGSLLSIRADLNNAVVSICPLISSSSSPYSNPLGTFPNTSTTIDATVILMFHRFSSPLARSKYLFVFRFLSFLLYEPPERANPLNYKVLLLLLLLLLLFFANFPHQR